MFGFLRRKKKPDPSPAPAPAAAETAIPEADAAGPDAPELLTPLAEPEAASSPSEPAAPLAAAPAPGIAADTPDLPEAARAEVPEAPSRPEPDAPESAPEPAPAPSRASWMTRLRQGLTRTRGNIGHLFKVVRIDEALFEDLETALLTSDAGVEATQRILDQLRRRVRERKPDTGDEVRQLLRELLAEQLSVLEKPIDIDEATPLVMMIAGVNGAGKTTSIGKLARHLQHEGKSILLAAGDTFRAAAREQLATWGERNQVQVIAQQGGDPAAVAFDAVSAGVARRTGVVMIDTAGRLPTQTHLMDELKKIHRVLGKAMAGAPHQSLLILDGNTGQNMLSQVAAFDAAVGLTGLIVTKLDGTAKGGALLGLAWQRRDRPIPVYFIGVGEGIDDLQAFSAAEFAEALVG